MRQRRFRASIYIDIMIRENKTLENEAFIEPVDKTLEEMREEARQKVQQVVDEIVNTENSNIPEEVFNPYLGDVALFTPGSLNPLDREI